MAPRTDLYDLGRLKLTSGEGRRLELAVQIGDFDFGGQRYSVPVRELPVKLEISKTTGGGYALRLRFSATLQGACMRCLEPAIPEIAVDAREVQQPGSGDEELISPYVDGEILDVAAWARDALALALPAQVVCRADCAGLCAICGANLNEAGPEHGHEAEPDPRWAKLRELKLE